MATTGSHLLNLAAEIRIEILRYAIPRRVVSHCWVPGRPSSLVEMQPENPKASIMLVCKQLRDEVSDWSDVIPVLRIEGLDRDKAGQVLRETTSNILGICREVEIIPSPADLYTIDLNDRHSLSSRLATTRIFNLRTCFAM
jgi:hypothetical protein